MKNKFILAAALVVISSVSAFAGSGKQTVPPYVVNAFRSDFGNSGKVSWEAGAGYYKAAFIQSGIPVYAYYTPGGDLMGTGRQLSNDVIPVSLDKSLQKNYPGYTVSEVYEMGAPKSADYLLVMTKGEQVLKLRSNADIGLVEVK